MKNLFLKSKMQSEHFKSIFREIFIFLAFSKGTLNNALRERKYEILVQNWTLRIWSDIAILKLSMAKVNRGESGKVFKHSKNQLWASWDHFWGLCKLPTFGPSCLSEPILGHFYLPESENMRFWLKIELWENDQILRFWSFLWQK